MVEKVAASTPHRAVEATCEGHLAGNSEKMAASTPNSHRHAEALGNSHRHVGSGRLHLSYARLAFSPNVAENPPPRERSSRRRHATQLRSMRCHFVNLIGLVNFVSQLCIERHVAAIGVAAALEATIAAAAVTAVAIWRGVAVIGVTVVASLITTALITAVLGGVRTVRWRERV